MIIVSKFGGSVTARAEGIKRAMEIVKSDSSRRYVIASAPGSIFSGTGITDMLFMCHSSFSRHENYQELLEKISESYRVIIDGLGMKFDIDAAISALRKDLSSGKNLDYIGSRGEYIMGKILAAYLGWDFVDASSIIFFNTDGSLNEAKTFIESKAKLSRIERAVIPGFYGTLPDGSAKTFPRGDGDSSGAIVARAVGADLFEKWSETAKTYSADMSVIPNPEIMRHITYSEAVELNYFGIFTVKDSVLFMLKEAGIPLRISGINDSDDECMMISENLPDENSRGSEMCIAGRRNFCIIHIGKYGLNKMDGFGEKLFGIFAKYHVPCEHCLSGIHKMSVVVKSPMFVFHHKQILDDIKQSMSPDSLLVENDLSLIAVISHGMISKPRMLERVFFPLARAGINVRMTDQGADDLNIIIGVSDDDYVRAVKAIYDYAKENRP